MKRTYTVMGMRYLLSEFRDWSEEREALSEHDGPSSDWHDSDDAGIDLLHRIAEALQEVLDNHWQELVGREKDE